MLLNLFLNAAWSYIKQAVTVHKMNFAAKSNILDHLWARYLFEGAVLWLSPVCHRHKANQSPTSHRHRWASPAEAMECNPCNTQTSNTENRRSNPTDSLEYSVLSFRFLLHCGVINIRSKGHHRVQWYPTARFIWGKWNVGQEWT